MRRIVVFAGMLVACTVAFADTAHITFLHVNDSHGVGVTVTNGNNCRLARVATIIQQVKAESGIDRVIVSNGGDIGVHCHDKDYLSTTTHGKAEIIALNAMGFDVLTPGNHEADRGVAWMQQLMALSRFPWLGANVYYANTTNYLMSGGSHVVFDVKGAKIAMMGLCAVANKWSTLRDGIIGGRDENDVGAELAPLLRGKCDFLVALTHIGDRADATLAAQNIDLILGGHEHSKLDGKKVNGTLIVQARWHHEFVARVDVTLSDSSGSWKVVKIMSKLLPTSDYEPDQKTITLLKKLEELVKAGSTLDDYYGGKNEVHP